MKSLLSLPYTLFHQRYQSTNPYGVVSLSFCVYLNFNERTKVNRVGRVARSSIRSSYFFFFVPTTHYPPRYRTSIRIRFTLTRISAIYIPPIRLPAPVYLFLFSFSFSFLFNLLVNPCHVKIPNFYPSLPFIYLFTFFLYAYRASKKYPKVLNNTCSLIFVLRSLSFFYTHIE